MTHLCIPGSFYCSILVLLRKKFLLKKQRGRNRRTKYNNNHNNNADNDNNNNDNNNDNKNNGKKYKLVPCSIVFFSYFSKIVKGKKFEVRMILFILMAS